MNSRTLVGLALWILTVLFGVVSTPQAALVKLQAESGILGANFFVGDDDGTQYITCTTNYTGGSPSNSTRVVTFNVTFPEAGTYDLYARVRVGAGAADDDSFLYGNGFGSESPTSDADWILCNNLANSRGFTSPTDVVTGAGTAGNQVWKWINASEFNGGEAPITFTVPAGALTQTFEIGGREDGLWIDAFVFGSSTSNFTVADLDGNTNGGPTLGTNGTCTVNWTDVRQRIDGFGGGVVFLNGETPDVVSDANMNTFFGTNSGQLALTLLRVRIDPNTNWSAALANAQKAVARGAGVLATPWTPPASMKDNGVLTNGSVLPSQYANYAGHLKSFANHLASNGAPLRALSIQNEPDWPTTYESCVWSGAQLRNFFLTNAGTFGNIPILMPESLRFNPSYSDPALNDPIAVTNVSLVGGHLYGDPVIQAYTNALNSGKPTWMTEFLINDQTIESAVQTAKQVHDCLVVANMSAYIWWKCIGSANGLVNPSGVPQKRGFVLSQWSRFVRPNDYRIGTTNIGPAFFGAYKNTNSSKFAIVAVNTNASTVITQTFNLTNFNVASVTPWITSATSSVGVQPAVTVSNGSFVYPLPATSVVTFVGQVATNAPNSTPTLTTVADQIINAGVTLKITNEVTDAESPPQTLTFSLLSTDPTNATLNPSSGVFTWRPLVSQADTTNMIIVKVSDDGVPSLSDTNTFTVTVNPVTQPTLDSILVVGGEVSLVVSGPEGPDYTLWTSTNLMDWNVLLTTNSPVSPVTIVDTNVLEDARFYRIQLGP